MGYSDEHNLQWDDFQCDNYFPSSLDVGCICEMEAKFTTEGTVNVTY